MSQNSPYELSWTICTSIKYLEIYMRWKKKRIRELVWWRDPRLCLEIFLLLQVFLQRRVLVDKWKVTKVDGRGAKSSDFSGVREVVPASLPLQEQNQVHSQQTFQRWVPPQINRLQYRDDEAVFRRVRG